MAEKTVKKNPESPKPRNQKKKSAPVLPIILLTLIAVAGVCGGTWLVLTGLDRRDAEKIAAQSSVIETEPGTTVTTEVTTTAETTTTTQRSLPPDSVTGISLSFTEVVMKVGDDTVMPLVTMTPEDAEDKSEQWESSDKNVAMVDDIGRIKPVGAGSCIIKVTSVNNPDVFAEVSVRVADPNAPASTTAAQNTAKPKNTAEVDGLEVKDDGATYVHGILIVNKTYALPKTFNPGGITKETMNAYHELEKAGADAGYTYTIVSGFRSFSVTAVSIAPTAISWEAPFASTTGSREKARNTSIMTVIPRAFSAPSNSSRMRISIRRSLRIPSDPVRGIPSR